MVLTCGRKRRGCDVRSKNDWVLIVKLLALVSAMTKTPRARMGFVCTGRLLIVIRGFTVALAGVTLVLTIVEALRSKLISTALVVLLEGMDAPDRT